jgi:hypothetical protein
MKLKIQCTGQAPLLMNSDRAVDYKDPIGREMKKLTAKRSRKTVREQEELDRLSYLAAIYYNKESGIYIPGANLWATFINGGKITRQGTAVRRGLVILDNEIPLIYDGPRTPDELEADGKFTSRLTVKVGSSRVVRVRPEFKSWSLATELQTDDTVLDYDTVVTVVRNAGEMVGLGDYRPLYGRFTSTIERL